MLIILPCSLNSSHTPKGARTRTGQLLTNIILIINDNVDNVEFIGFEVGNFYGSLLTAPTSSASLLTALTLSSSLLTALTSSASLLTALTSSAYLITTRHLC